MLLLQTNMCVPVSFIWHFWCF